MGTILDLITKDSEQAERLAGYAVKENPNIKNFEDFEQAFLKAFNTSQGDNLINFLNNDENRILFKTKVVQEAIKGNISEEEYDEIKEETKDIHVIRAVPKGEKTKIKDFVVINVQRPAKVHSYIKGQRTIKSYSKSYSNWSPAQEKYIISQKTKKVPTRQLIANYNKQFKENQRTPSSLKSKIYRV
jgi:hypothetical protein